MSNDQGADAAQEGDSERPVSSGPMNWKKMIELTSARRIDVAMWATRLLTLIFAAGYVFPIMGYVFIVQLNSFAEPSRVLGNNC